MILNLNSLEIAFLLSSINSFGCCFKGRKVLLAFLALLILLLQLGLLHHHALRKNLGILKCLKLVSGNVWVLFHKLLIERDITLLRNRSMLDSSVI